MSRIAILGGTGNVGQRLTAEALRRGHRVTIVARNPPAELPDGAGFVKGDVTADAQAVGAAITGHDVLISATRFADVAAADVLAAARAAGISRLLVVGGAGSLEVAPGVRLFDTPEFPEAYKPEALAGGRFLDILRSVADLDWSFLSPAAIFGPGERTGTFRLGGDQFMPGPQGPSTVSYEDFAVAMLDEIEAPKHVRQRFSIAY